MTVVEKEHHTAPRSALRHRPIDTGQALASPTMTRARKSRPDTRVTMVPATPDDRDREELPISRRHLAAPAHQARTKPRVHPLLLIGIGTLMTLILWMGVTQLIAWGTNQYNAIVYGSPRTFQIDAAVGQGDNVQHPSHFVAINLHGVITILDFPAGDASHVHQLASFSVPGPNADQAVALLRFIDLNHNGQPAMLIRVNDLQSILVNDGKTFRQPTPMELQQMLQELQQMRS